MCGPAKIALGIGSNVGDRLGSIRLALEMIAAWGAEGLTASDVYETPPWGNESQGRFLNACATFRADSEPFALLRCLKAIEKRLGRVERAHWGPREIDLDILLWGDLRLRTPTLSIPHPYMHQRAFVLVPLAQIAGGMRHPVLALSVAELLARQSEESLRDILRVAGA